MKSEMISTRLAFGKELAELGSKYPNLIVMDADLSKSTMTDIFASRFPDRFFDAGIAEQNMVGVAAGLSKTGKIVVAASLAYFIMGRAFDQVRNLAAHSNCNVKFIGTHAGISIGKDGSSHQAIEDIAIARAIPGMRVIVPADGNETRAALRKIIETDGVFYLRLGRGEVENITSQDKEFMIGSPTMIYASKGEPDICIIACGMLVHESIKAAKSLERSGINANIINQSTLKPVNREELMGMIGDVRKIITVEEHNIIGGLGSAVPELFDDTGGFTVRRLGIMDTFAESGEPEELFDKYGISAQHIEKTAIDMIRKI
ncbi:MAG: transketolase family protein [Actinobacteria bacterium]|nr:transketolase family protein [Actinomycetota bacterium]